MPARPPPSASPTRPPTPTRLTLPALTRTRFLLLAAAAPLACLALSSSLRSASHVPIAALQVQQQQRHFASHPPPPHPTTPANNMPFPKEGAEKSAKSQAANKPENWAGRTYSAKEEKEFGRLGSRMEDFHSYFRQAFNEVYLLADGSFAKRGYTLPAFLNFADDLYKHLEAHHGIEERFMFPLLSKRMTQAFGETHPESHRQIHAGLDAYHALLASWRREPSSFSPVELRKNMDSWREVLFRHLDEEVADLGKENMLKFWTIEEVRRLPI